MLVHIRGEGPLNKQAQNNHIEHGIYGDANVVLTCGRASLDEFLPRTPPGTNGPFLVELSYIPLVVRGVKGMKQYGTVC